MNIEYPDITSAYWNLLEKIKNCGNKNYTSMYPAMSLNFQQLIITNPLKNWLECPGFKYSIFWTLREFSDRITRVSRIQNPGYAIRYDKNRWQKRIEGIHTTEKMEKLKKSHSRQYIDPQNIRPGKFSYTYGERWYKNNQLDFISDKLSNPFRWNHIFLSVWDYYEDNHRFGRRVPCTVGIQFIPNKFKVDDKHIKVLDCLGIMRNNLINSFFISDIFCFTALYQWLSAKHNFKIGRYCHNMGKVYYQYKIRQHVRIVNSFNDYKKYSFNIYDHYEPQTFGSGDFERDWKIKEELEEHWRKRLRFQREDYIDKEGILHDIDLIEDEYIKNWAKVMAVGELILTQLKDKNTIKIMIELTRSISNEWQWSVAKELIPYIGKSIKKERDRNNLIEEVFEIVPGKTLKSLGKEVIFRSRKISDDIESMIPGSYQRYFDTYKNSDIDLSEFRGDKKSIRLYKEWVLENS